MDEKYCNSNFIGPDQHHWRLFFGGKHLLTGLASVYFTQKCLPFPQIVSIRLFPDICEASHLAASGKKNTSHLVTFFTPMTHNSANHKLSVLCIFTSLFLHSSSVVSSRNEAHLRDVVRTEGWTKVKCRMCGSGLIYCVKIDHEQSNCLNDLLFAATSIKYAHLFLTVWVGRQRIQRKVQKRWVLNHNRGAISVS